MHTQMRQTPKEYYNQNIMNLDNFVNGELSPGLGRLLSKHILLQITDYLLTTVISCDNSSDYSHTAM